MVALAPGQVSSETVSDPRACTVFPASVTWAMT